MDKFTLAGGARRPTRRTIPLSCGLDGPRHTPDLPRLSGRAAGGGGEPAAHRLTARPLALARRWRAEGVRKRDAEDGPSARCGYGPLAPIAARGVGGGRSGLPRRRRGRRGRRAAGPAAAPAPARPDAARSLAGLLRAGGRGDARLTHWPLE